MHRRNWEALAARQWWVIRTNEAASLKSYNIYKTLSGLNEAVLFSRITMLTVHSTKLKTMWKKKSTINNK
jgi:hypothetical protein